MFVYTPDSSSLWRVLIPSTVPIQRFAFESATYCVGPLSRGSSFMHLIINQCKMCDLEIDVNGQEKFLVNKKILACYSIRLRKLFRKLTDTTSRLKVIFHDFPGGAEGFELIVQFCYNGGKLNINPSNIILLHYAAIFMEMDEDKYGAYSLIQQTEEYCKGIHQFAWPELLECLKQCQDLLHIISSSDMFQAFLDCLVGRFSLCSVLSPYASSTDSSCVQFSGDISHESISNFSSQTTTWWFDDLDFLKIDLFEKLVETMISKKLDKYTISSFLFHYQKMKFNGFLLAKKAEKRRIMETLINLLYMLDRNLIPRRSLFDNLRFSLALKLNGCSKNKLESLIGSILDQAKLDDLLLPSPPGKRYAYDVDLILRLQKQFLLENRKQFLMYRLKKVALLMDSFIAEVAPDPRLEPSKFVALTTTLPDLARDSHDMIYQAIDMYLKVHNKISLEEKIKICCVLNYNKLSAGSLIHLAHNMDFLACAKVTASSVSRHSKLKVLPQKIGHFDNFHDSKASHITSKGFRANTEDENQVEYVKKPTKKFNRKSRLKKVAKLRSICSNNSKPLYGQCP